MPMLTSLVLEALAQQQKTNLKLKLTQSPLPQNHLMEQSLNPPLNAMGFITDLIVMNLFSQGNLLRMASLQQTGVFKQYLLAGVAS